MDFVDEIDLTVALAELVFRVDEDQSALGGDVLSALEDLTGIVLHHGVVFSRDDALGDDLLTGDIHVVALVGLCRRGDDGLRETLVLLHAVGELHAAEFTAAVLVLTPGRACEDAADDHLHAKTFALHADGHHGVGSRKLPVRTDVGCGIEELGGNLVQHLTFVGDALWQHHVECGDAVGSHHYQKVVVDVVNVTDLSVINAFLSLKLELCLC